VAAAPASQKDVRQPNLWIIHAKRKGEMAPPIPTPAATKPHVNARRYRGTQFAFILPQAG